MLNFYTCQLHVRQSGPGYRIVHNFARDITMKLRPLYFPDDRQIRDPDFKI